QPQGLAHARAVAHAADRGAVHSDLRGVHLPQGPPGARRSDGISHRAFPALEPAARSDSALAVVSSAARGASRDDTRRDGEARGLLRWRAFRLSRAAPGYSSSTLRSTPSAPVSPGVRT